MPAPIDRTCPVCPGCGTTMVTDRVFDDFACPKCGLAGPADVLEALARVRGYMIKYDECAAYLGEINGVLGKHALAPHDEAVTAVRELRAEVERLKSPAVVLAEAERLLREARVSRVLLSRDRPKRSGDGMRERNCTVTQFSELPYGDDRRAESGETVADAYAALVKETP